MDNLVNELVKYEGENLKQKLHKLITELWKKKEMPKDLGKGIFLPILKRDEPTVRSNYRGITLLNVC